MTELVLFGLVGLFAVGFAIAMLLSDNAVHSALFLIGTMGCIAFLFLLLNAPFLAMIQVTVYTGAIMVLFLFVIMLLGSERLKDTDAGAGVQRGRWDTRLAVGLVLALLLIVGIVIGQVNLNLSTDTGELPQLRVVNAAADVGTVDVFANDEAIASGIAFRDVSGYVSLQPGTYTIKMQPATGDAVTTDVTLERGTQQTVVGYGDTPNLDLRVVTDNNSTIESAERSARLAFFNADADLGAMRLVDLGSSLSVTNAPTLIDGLVPGQMSDPILVPESTVNWAFVDANNPASVLYRLDNYPVSRDTSGLVVLTQERVFNGVEGGVLRALAIPAMGDAAPSFGGPRAIGEKLFTDYLLVFQLLAVLLLAAMVGAIVLTHRQTKSETRKAANRRVVSRPLVNVIASQVGHDVTSGEAVPELQEPK